MATRWMLFVLVAGALAGCTAPQDPGATTGETPPLLEGGGYDLSLYGVNGDPFLGDLNASVQVVSYEAPGCSSCKRYHFSALPGILEDFAATNQIGYHFLQWNVGYSYDEAGSIAAECAHREGGTPAYKHILDLIFSTQHKPDQIPGYLDDTAAAFGLDASTLRTCYDDKETLAEVNADIQGGISSKAGSNPGFAIIGPDGVELVKGTVGPRAAIERALAA